MAASYIPQYYRDLGLITEKIPLGDQIFGRADLIYVIAYRAATSLIETLAPPRTDHSRIE